MIKVIENIEVAEYCDCNLRIEFWGGSIANIGNSLSKLTLITISTVTSSSISLSYV